MLFKDLHNEICTSDKTIESLQKIFYETAKHLLKTKVLKILDQEIELTEIEFYFFTCDNHSDPYVHIDSLQKSSNKLYVHKQAWDRGGIDITFGNGRYFGGILIRGIKHNNNYISGSATVKKYIANKIDTSIDKHRDLQKYFEINQSEIFLIDKYPLTDIQLVLHSTRVGLNSEKDINYANALYRFVTEDYLISSIQNFESYTNLKERTKIKAISYLTLKYPTNEKAAIKSIESNKVLCRNIKNFIKLINPKIKDTN